MFVLMTSFQLNGLVLNVVPHKHFVIQKKYANWKSPFIPSLQADIQYWIRFKPNVWRVILRYAANIASLFKGVGYNIADFFVA